MNRESLNRLLILVAHGGSNECISAQERILAEFDRLTEERDKAIKWWNDVVPDYARLSRQVVEQRGLKLMYKSKVQELQPKGEEEERILIIKYAKEGRFQMIVPFPDHKLYVGWSDKKSSYTVEVNIHSGELMVFHSSGEKPKDCEHPHLLRIGKDIGYSDVVVCQDCGAQGILRLHLITEEDVQPDTSL